MSAGCELCEPQDVIFESEFAYVRYDNHALARGHVIVVPRRHVADFFEMSGAEQGSVVALLNRAKKRIEAEHRPDGYNIGVNIGKAAGQSRMHVHVHLIPRYAGDAADLAKIIRDEKEPDFSYDHDLAVQETVLLAGGMPTA